MFAVHEGRQSTHSRHSYANGLGGKALPIRNEGAADAAQRLVLKDSLHVERFICSRSLQILNYLISTV